MYKIIAIAVVCFVLLAFGFSRWKKKYGYTNSGKASGDTKPKTEGGGLPNYPKEEPKPTNDFRKAEQAADRATAMADKVYKASRGKAKGKGR